MQASIGEMVSEHQINSMNEFIDKHGEQAFSDAVYHLAFGEVANAYIHPHDDMKATKNFSIIQKAFINAYV
jgi:hypothetical protein